MLFKQRHMPRPLVCILLVRLLLSFTFSNTRDYSYELAFCYQNLSQANISLFEHWDFVQKEPAFGLLQVLRLIFLITLLTLCEPQFDFKGSQAISTDSDHNLGLGQPKFLQMEQPCNQKLQQYFKDTSKFPAWLKNSTFTPQFNHQPTTLGM